MASTVGVVKLENYGNPKALELWCGVNFYSDAYVLRIVLLAGTMGELNKKSLKGKGRQSRPQGKYIPPLPVGGERNQNHLCRGYMRLESRGDIVTLRVHEP
jgi:hypothetical protein